jgi:hypothetical protein
MWLREGSGLDHLMHDEKPIGSVLRRGLMCVHDQLLVEVMVVDLLLDIWNETW